MWQVYLTGKTFSQRPSNLLEITDRWIALQFDNAVAYFGTIIEGALNEQVKTGSDEKPKWEPKYRLDQLLDPDFRLPAPPTEQEKQTDAFRDFASKVGFRTIKVDN